VLLSKPSVQSLLGDVCALLLTTLNNTVVIIVVNRVKRQLRFGRQMTLLLVCFVFMWLFFCFWLLVGLCVGSLRRRTKIFSVEHARLLSVMAERRFHINIVGLE
jgi:hypothetical protein